MPLGGSGFGLPVVRRALGEAHVQEGLWDTRSALKDRFGPNFREISLGRPGPLSYILRALRPCIHPGRLCGKGSVRGVVIHCASLFESLFVTLVFEIMNIHCLIQVTQAPAPSGYFEVILLYSC